MKRKKYKKRKFFDKFSYSNRNTSIFLVITFLFIIFGLTIGYSVLSNVLSIKGDVAIRPFKDIRITSVTGPEISNGAYETYNFKYSHNLLVVNGVLPNTSSSLTYTITITNNGTVDMDLIDIINSCTDSNVYYELNGIKLGDTIEAGTSKTFTITLKTRVGNNNSFTSQLQFIFEESYVDITPPEIVFNPVATGNWSNSNYNVEITATDDIEVTSFMYCITTNDSCTPNIVITNNSNVNVAINTSSGTNTICALASDSSKYGPNSITVCSNKDGKYYKLDKEKPSINPTITGTTGNNGWYKSNVVINVNGNDLYNGVNLSGYKGHRYQTSTNNGSSYGNLSDYTTNNITINQECVDNKVKITGYDNVLNGSNTYTSGTIKIDKTAPVIEVDGHTSNYSVDYIMSEDICEPVNGEVSYELGTAYICDPGDGTTRTFYMLEENDDTVSLIMDRNLGGNIPWISKTDYIAAGGSSSDYGTNGETSFGPITAQNYLNEVTSDWIDVKVSLPTAWQIAAAGNATYSPMLDGSVSISGSWLYDNLFCATNTCAERVPNDTAAAGDVHSYHTSTPSATLSYIFSQVEYNGLISGQYPATDYLVGIRPVITINKSHISK